jgi:hypothetical protein
MFVKSADKLNTRVSEIVAMRLGPRWNDNMCWKVHTATVCNAQSRRIPVIRIVECNGFALVPFRCCIHDHSSNSVLRLVRDRFQGTRFDRLDLQVRWNFIHIRIEGRYFYVDSVHDLDRVTVTRVILPYFAIVPRKRCRKPAQTAFAAATAPRILLKHPDVADRFAMGVNKKVACAKIVARRQRK